MAASMHASFIKRLLILGFGCALVACQGDQGDDLDAFMRNAPSDKRPKVKALPEVQAYSAMQYNADGQLVDPFRARKVARKAGALQPNLSRPRQLLESYPLESLKYVGSIAKAKLQYALLLTPDHGVQQVRLGQYLGQDFGVVTKISETQLDLKEIVQDDLSGDWVERLATLNLQE
jgi:type IV pilus assembly protein PilP